MGSCCAARSFPELRKKALAPKMRSKYYFLAIVLGGLENEINQCKKKKNAISNRYILTVEQIFAQKVLGSVPMHSDYFNRITFIFLYFTLISLIF